MKDAITDRIFACVLVGCLLAGFTFLTIEAIRVIERSQDSEVPTKGAGFVRQSEWKKTVCAKCHINGRAVNAYRIYQAAR